MTGGSGAPGRHLRRRHRHRRAPEVHAGTRLVAIPPHLVPVIRDHLLTHPAPGRDGLLFRSAGGRHLHSGSAMHDAFHVARARLAGPT